MGTIIGSIYPLDKIIYEEGSYLNQVNPAEAAASGGATGTGMAAQAAASGGAQAIGTITNTAIAPILAKYGVTEPKPLLTMTLSELRGYKRVLEKAVKTASPESDKNAIRLKITEVQSVINEKSKEKSKGIWGDIWGGLVTLSGAKPEETEPIVTTQVITQAQLDELKREEDKRRKNTTLYIGLGIGGVLVLGTLGYLAFRKK